eukprot:1840952-Prymnesium_polylepis.1
MLGDTKDVSKIEASVSRGGLLLSDYSAILSTTNCAVQIREAFRAAELSNELPIVAKARANDTVPPLDSLEPPSVHPCTVIPTRADTITRGQCRCHQGNPPIVVAMRCLRRYGRRLRKSSPRWPTWSRMSWTSMRPRRAASWWRAPRGTSASRR